MKEVGMCSIEEDEEVRKSAEYKALEEFSNWFVKSNEDILKEYRWSRDPFHAWSRGFEYTYALKQIMENEKREKGKIADLGSGVTFFPFYLADRRFEVEAFDINVEYLKLYHRISSNIKLEVQFYPRTMEYIPIENTYQTVYCLSVIEHLEKDSYRNIIDTIFKILKDGGKFIFTLDVSRDKNDVNCIENIRYFLNILNQRFGSNLDENEVYYDSKNINPRYIVERRKTSDVFHRTPKQIVGQMMASIYKRQKIKIPRRYPEINIYYGHVTKKRY